MRFVKELRRANSALVDAFEKSKKRQQADKRRLKLELVTYMNRVQGTGGGEVSVLCSDLYVQPDAVAVAVAVVEMFGGFC